MKRLITIITIMSILMITTIANSAGKQRELTISAAASLKDVMFEIGNNYQKKHPKIKINFNFGSSGALQTQIEQGAPADIFISAAEKQMDNLEAKNLLKRGTRFNLLENQLVLVVLKNSNIGIRDFGDLASAQVKSIGIGAPESVPAGEYAKQSLKFIGIWDKIQQKLIYGSNVRTVLTYIETGNVDAGIVYRSDTIVSDKVKIVATAVPGSHEPSIYPAAILADSKQPQAAKDFLNYLRISKNKEIFAKFGFKVI